MNILYTITKYLASPIENFLILYFLIKYLDYKNDSTSSKVGGVLAVIFVTIIAQFTGTFYRSDVILRYSPLLQFLFCGHIADGL